MVVESRTFGPRGVDGDRWLGGMAIVATCGAAAAGGDQITCSALSCHQWLLHFPPWMDSCATSNSTSMDWTSSSIGGHGVLGFRWNRVQLCIRIMRPPSSGKNNPRSGRQNITGGFCAKFSISINLSMKVDAAFSVTHYMTACFNKGQ